MIELKGELDKSIIIGRDLSTPLSVTNRTALQKICKVIEELNNILKPPGFNWHFTKYTI